MVNSDKNHISFFVHNIEVEEGREYRLTYHLPVNQTFTYSYSPDYYINVNPSQTSKVLVIKGLHVGNSTIWLYDSENNIVDKCNVRVKKSLSSSRTPTPTYSNWTNTSNPISEWAFEKHNSCTTLFYS